MHTAKDAQHWVVEPVLQMLLLLLLKQRTPSLNDIYACIHALSNI
jgi:hypothetical protein